MALRLCRECGQSVSTDAKACPHCGAPRPAQEERSTRAAIAIVLGVILLVWLGSSILDSNTSSRGDVGPSLACLPVDEQLIQDIASGLTGGANALWENARAYRSGAHRNGFFVATEIDGSGLMDVGDYGVWLTNSIDGPSGMILSVSAAAIEFSDWGDASRTDAEATMADPGAREAVECFRQLQSRLIN